ncbi:MAG: TadE/TadG family type IV pilus assembly protein [Planctomycetota bacterium]
MKRRERYHRRLCAAKARSRRGTSIVETAVVLPVFLLLLFAIFEFGHAQLINNLLASGCRNAARLGSVEGTTTADVTAHVDQVLSAAIDPDALSTFVKDASTVDAGAAPDSGAAIEAMPNIELSEAEPRQLFVVRASVPYNSIAIVPMPFLKSVTLDAQAFMRHE